MYFFGAAVSRKATKCPGFLQKISGHPTFRANAILMFWRLGSEQSSKVATWTSCNYHLPTPIEEMYRSRRVSFTKSPKKHEENVQVTKV